MKFNKYSNTYYNFEYLYEITKYSNINLKGAE